MFSGTAGDRRERPSRVDCRGGFRSVVANGPHRRLDPVEIVQSANQGRLGYYRCRATASPIRARISALSPAIIHGAEPASPANARWAASA
jgi:hypothetical protein